MEEDGNVEREAENGMWGLKVLVPGASFVDLDYDEANEEGCDSNEVDEEVGYGAGALL